VPAAFVVLRAPVRPGKFIGLWNNFHELATKQGNTIPTEPLTFLKSPGSIVGPEAPILPPPGYTGRVIYEGELAIVIGRTAKNVSKENALDYVLGYTCANDVSARDWQIKLSSGQWCRGKIFDTFCPLGPWIVTKDEIPNPDALRIRTILNGATMQDSTTADMIFSVSELIAFFSASTTILPGTVILTGTPSGVGMARKPPVWLQAGDSVTIEIEKISSLTNPVALE